MLFSFHLSTPLSLFPQAALLSSLSRLSGLIDFPLNINREKQVRKEQHPLAVCLAEILDLSLSRSVFLSIGACQMTSRLEC